MNEMSEHWVVLRGCDDTTKFRVKLTPEQAEFLRTISLRSEEASDYGCQPTIRTFPVSACCEHGRELAVEECYLCL